MQAFSGGRHPLSLLVALILVAGCSPDPPVEDTLDDASFDLVNQDSSAVSFPDAFEGRPVVVGYIYTNCPNVCPQITANMRSVRETLDQPEEVQFATVTFDPKRDTPSQLAEYQADFKLDDTSWQFLTGSPATIDSLMSRMDVRHDIKPPADTTAADSSDYLFVHSNRITLLDGQGRVRAEYNGSRTPPEHIVEDLQKVMQ